MTNKLDISALRILQITPVYEPAYVYGGPTRSIPLLCKSLVNQGVAVTVFTTDANGANRLDVPTDTPVYRDGVKVWYSRRDSQGSFHYSRQFNRVAMDYAGQFDLIHSSGVWNYGMIVASNAARKHHVPHLVAPRNALTRWAYDFKPFRKRLYMWSAGEKLRLNRASGLHYTTELEKLDSAFLKLRPPTYVVPNPIDLAQFAGIKPPGFLRHKLGLSADDFLLGMVGRLHPKKGYDLAIEALAQVVTDYPEAQLVLIGPDEGHYLEQIRQLTQVYQLQDNVHWVGQLEGTDLVEAYSDLDCLLLPSRSESFGNVVVEAMAAGIPVLISDQVGIAPDVAKVGAGSVFPLNIPDISRAISNAIKNLEQNHRMGLAGKILSEQKYSPDAVARAMIEAYLAILENNAK